MLLHFLEKLDDDLGGRPDQNLSPATFFSVGNGLEAISQNRHAHHLNMDISLLLEREREICEIAG
jgi:hypothetical protein